MQVGPQRVRTLCKEREMCEATRIGALRGWGRAKLGSIEWGPLLLRGPRCTFQRLKPIPTAQQPLSAVLGRGIATDGLPWDAFIDVYDFIIK